MSSLCPGCIQVATFSGSSSQSCLTRLLEDGKRDSHSEALLRAYSVAGNIYFCPEMSRGEPTMLNIDGSHLIVDRDRGSFAWGW